MNESTPACIACERTSADVPLIKLEFQGSEFWICPQDLPVLIHKPGKLSDRLPGAENLKPAEGH